MVDRSLTHRSACELISLVRSKQVSPLDVLDAHLAVIDQLNPSLNAVITLAAEQARAGARVASIDSILCGLPIVIKDVTETAGIRTTYGSPIYRDNVPKADAEVVRRFKAAGAIVLGKTNTPEFATGANTTNALFGATRNPWNPALSPAGSSGGSAVAVATGMVPLAHGTDFGGSVRVPAAFCGLVGLRPTPGLTPNHPMALAWDPGQVHGPLARTAEDAALLLDAMVGFDRISPISVAPPWKSALSLVEATRDLKGLRLAFAPDIAGIGIDSQIARECRRASLALSDAGATVDEIDFDASDGREPFMTWRGAWMVGQRHPELSRIDEFGPNLKGNVNAGLKVTALDLAAAEQKRAAVFQHFKALFDCYDVLLTPTAAVPPFPVEQNFPDQINGRRLENYIDWLAQSFLVTLVSLPAASVPAGKTDGGLPVGLQIVAPRFEEPRILSVAKLVQRANPIGWPTQA
jgi:amidase